MVKNSKFFHLNYAAVEAGELDEFQSQCCGQFIVDFRASEDAMCACQLSEFQYFCLFVN
jgi:hypothetical protein